MEIFVGILYRRDLQTFGIRWPSEDQIKKSYNLLYRNRIHGRVLQGVFGILDGSRMPCATYTDPFPENAYWEEVTQMQVAANLVVWNFYGDIIFVTDNFPGSRHDSKLSAAGGLYFPLFGDKTPLEYAIVEDSAFPTSEPL